VIPASRVELQQTFAMAQRVFLRTGRGLALTPRSLQITRPFSTVLDTLVDPGTQQLRSVARTGSVFENALNASAPRTNWTKEEISEVYNTSLIDLTYASVCQATLWQSGGSLSYQSRYRLRCTGASMTPQPSRCAHYSTSKQEVAARIAPTVHSHPVTIPV
jgi:hypothetical protein